MQKLLVLTLFLLSIQAKNYAQSNLDKPIANKDSIQILKAVPDTSEEDEASSYFTLELGLGNRIFDVPNAGLTAKTSPLNTLVWSPSIVYHHKSGLYFSVGNSLLKDNTKKIIISFYSMAVGYELPDNENIDMSVAYTHYFVNDYFSPYAPPVQNDFWGSLTYKKTWIKPGMSLGYSAGHYGDVKRVLHLYDSVTSNIKSFSLGFSASHEFKWPKIFGKEDALSFSPSLMLNTFKGNIAYHHNTNSNLANFLNNKGRLPKFDDTKFQVESMGCDLNAGYELGKFSLEPEVYMDYYLQASDGKRLSTFLTLNIKYSL